MIRIDIISDVVCPWCVIGFKQLEAALLQEGCAADIHWQPFELNPDISSDGEDLREHLVRKYGMSADDAKASEQRIAEVGQPLGFPFRFYDGMRIVNTFNAHQLIHWAALHNRQHELKLTLFHCHFNRMR
ncbi:MAG: DsbA family oxidoreductase, partial [Pseudomonadota bacterium]